MFKSLYNNPILSDITIKCGDRAWYAHKSILYLGSQYFKTLFSGSLDESHSNEIVLDFSPSTTEFVIKYLYSYETISGDMDTVLEIFELANYLQIEKLMGEMDRHLRQMVSVENSHAIYKYYRTSNLLEWICVFIARNLNSFTDIAWMQVDEFSRMIVRDDLRVKNKQELINIVVSYISFHSLDVSLVSMANTSATTYYGKVNPRNTYDFHITTCAVCRNKLDESCIECTANDIKECDVSHGYCGHTYHKHCIDRWLKHREVCPLDNHKWNEHKF